MTPSEFYSRIRESSRKLNIISLSKEFMIVTLGQIISILGSIVGIKLLTNFLTPTNYGELALGLTISGFFSQIIYGPLSQAIYRFWSSAIEEKKEPELLSGIIYLQAICSMIVFVITIILLIIFVTSHLPTKWIGLLIAASVFIFFGGISISIDVIQQAVRQRIIVAIHQVLGQWLYPLAIILLFIILPKSSVTAFWGQALVVIVVLMSRIFFFYKLNKSSMTWKIQRRSMHWIKVLLNYAWPFCIWGIFTWGQLSSDRWSLQLFGYSREVGLYSVLIQLGYTPIIILSTIVMQFLTPFVFKIAGDGSDKARIKQATRINIGASLSFLFLISLVAGIFIFINHPFMAVFSSKAYLEVSGYLPLIILSGGLFSAGQILSISLLSRRETKSLLVPKSVTAILGIIMYILGARLLGLRGVIMGNIAFSTIYFLWILAIIFIVKIDKTVQQIG